MYKIFFFAAIGLAVLNASDDFSKLVIKTVSTEKRRSDARVVLLTGSLVREKEIPVALIVGLADEDGKIKQRSRIIVCGETVASLEQLESLVKNKSFYLNIKKWQSVNKKSPFDFYKKNISYFSDLLGLGPVPMINIISFYDKLITFKVERGKG